MGGSEDVPRPRDAVNETIERTSGSLLQPEENALKRWVLINGNRGVVAAISLLVVGLGFAVFGFVWTTEITDLFTETDVVQTLLFTLLSGTILLVSIAVSINAVVLSQELTALGEQKEQIDDVLSFRAAVQELTSADVSPARPAEFLRVILRAARNRADESETQPGTPTRPSASTPTFSSTTSRSRSTTSRSDCPRASSEPPTCSCPDSTTITSGRCTPLVGSRPNTQTSSLTPSATRSTR